MARTQGLALPSGNRGLLVMAALAGLAAAVLFVVAINNNDSNSNALTSSTGKGNTVVAIKDIPAASKIEADMVAVKEVPNDLVVTHAFTDNTAVVGQYAAYDITAGEQVTPARIGTATGRGLAFVVDPGTRGVAIQVKEVTAAGGALLPGDRVDIIGNFKVANELKDCNQQYMQRTETILQNVQVLKVGPEQLQPRGAQSAASDPRSGTSGTVPADVTQQPGAATVTVALTPGDTQTVISAQGRARTVWMSLRAVGDTEPKEVLPLDKCLYE